MTAFLRSKVTQLAFAPLKSANLCAPKKKKLFNKRNQMNILTNIREEEKILNDGNKYYAALM